jgi:hypothetical protein
MDEVAEFTFRTKTGICTVTPDRLVIKREGIRGEMARQTFGNSIGRALGIYGILGVLSLVGGIWLLIKANYASGSILSLLGAVYVFSVIISWNNSAASVIERSLVQSVGAHRPHFPFTRGWFTVHFLDDGKKRKRFIPLPGGMSGGGKEYRHALSVMKKTGWVS